jgi:acetyl esterase
MPLDPAAKVLMDQIAALGGPQLHEMSPVEARESFKAMAAMAGDAIEVARVENRTIPGPASAIPIRIYTPQGGGRLPVLVYFHGGGWVIGGLDTHDRTCRGLANAGSCVVVSVDYRLAPENAFPAAPDDCFCALQWVAANASEHGGDTDRIAVGGDSAGGNLAAVVAQMARDRNGPPVRYQLLIYPVTDSARDTASYRDNGEGYFLTGDGMAWFWQQYLPSPQEGAHPYASPLRAEDVSGLPPGLVITAEYDPLRDEGEAYAARLREAGVSVETCRYDGMIHGFVGMGAVLSQGDEAIEKAGQVMRSALGGE